MRLTADECLARLRGGDELIITHPNPFKLSDKGSFTFKSCGHHTTKAAFEAIRDQLEPVESGLFGDVPQVYRLK